MQAPLDGPDELTRTYNLMRNTRNAERWTAEEWLRLGRAYRAGAWDVTPDEWTEQQLREALRKRNPLAPQWGYKSGPENAYTGLHPIDGAPMVTK
jgi:hypothetical protein